MNAFWKHSALFWIAVLSIPLLGLVPKTIKLAGETAEALC
jgi:hypothetical protein